MIMYTFYNLCTFFKSKYFILFQKLIFLKNYTMYKNSCGFNENNIMMNFIQKM